MAFKNQEEVDTDAPTGELNDDINNPTVTTTEEEGYDAASALNENQDSDVAKPPIPDSWPNAKGVYEPLIYTSVWDFATADVEEQVKEYGEGARAFRSFNIKGKITGVNNENIPSKLYQGKPVNFVNISTMVGFDGTCTALDFIKAALGKRTGERLIVEAKRQLEEMNLKSKSEEKNNRWNDLFEEIVRSAILSGNPVKFTPQWLAEYEGDKTTKSGKAKYETAMAGMKNFPKDDTIPCGHSPIVTAKNGLEVAAKFKVKTWIPNREM